ncbi:ATP-binding protein [Paenibacillus sp. HJGM_3]|uniref:ATP-binding protein n=1 Tax=Paenibacillus sp. HJGM_3 TaxID=3379816 RepID=UPI00385B5BC6
MRLQTKLILLICSVLLFVTVVLAFSFQRMWENSLKDQIGTTALNIAKAVAVMPVIRDAFDDPDPSKTINPLVETIRQQTGAEFIVVGNRNGIRYSHPNPERIGQDMVGGDNGPVFEGKSIVSEAVGTLGLSLRGKTPIYDDQERIIGVVSVGFLIEDINETAVHYRNSIVLLATITLLVGAGAATLIARNVKKSIHGLEPEEIGHLYGESRAILESVREGILAVDRSGRVTVINMTAQHMLGYPSDAALVGRHILDVLPTSRLMEVLRTGEAEFDKEMLINEVSILVNRLPVTDEHGHVIGAVSSFRNKDELYRLSEELSQVKQYAEGLRAQTHEFSNKLYTISGLIQLESYQEALHLIAHETDVHQDLIRFIMREIPDPMIGGVLIGKFNRAKELKVVFEVDRESSFRDVPASIPRGPLVTIIGNLIDNAMDAVLAVDRPSRWVSILLTDLGDDLIIEVEDNGCGVPDELTQRIFETGFSTKDENRGFGLPLVKQAVEQLKGNLTFARGEFGGTVFTVALPKERRDSHAAGTHY